MITWIIGFILVIWLLFKRYGKDGKIEGFPLSMPRGTVRAFITLLVITFPLIYIINGEQIPRLIINAIFVLVAFYFQSRKDKTETIKHIIKELKNPEKYEEIKKREQKPLYFPKYTVRSFLLITLVAITLLNFLGPVVPFETTTNTLVDLLIIVVFFMVGAFFKKIGNSKEKDRIKNQLSGIEENSDLSIYELLESLLEDTSSWLAKKGKNFLSLATLLAVITSLLCYTIGWDYIIFSLPFYVISLRETLLLLVNLYYGFRD